MNYRPVSVISVASKTMEQILVETMLGHVEDRDLIGDSQHGFTRGKFHLTSLEAFYDRIIALVDEGGTDIIYLDLCKAFHSVQPKTLVSEVERHGLDG